MKTPSVKKSLSIAPNPNESAKADIFHQILIPGFVA